LILISDDLWAFSNDFESSLKTDFPVVAFQKEVLSCKIYGNLIEDSKIVLYSLQSWNVVNVKREANMAARTPIDHKDSVSNFYKENLNERVP
jgi:hypothetical protein